MSATGYSITVTSASPTLIFTAALAALASGLAIGGAPLLLAVPGLLFVLAIRAGKPDPGRSSE